MDIDVTHERCQPASQLLCRRGGLGQSGFNFILSTGLGRFFVKPTQ